MTFRTRLLAIFAVSMGAAVAVVSWTISVSARRAFDQVSEQRRRALVAQFNREFERRGADIVARLEGMAGSEAAVRMAIGLGRADADASAYVYQAQELARAHGLDVLDITGADASIISSAHWSARFGYKLEWLAQPVDWKTQGAFLHRIETPDGEALAILSVRTVAAGDRRLHLAGGLRIDQRFLESLSLPAGMRVLLSEPSKPAPEAALASLVGEVMSTSREATRTVWWSGEEAESETFQAIPLAGRDKSLLAVLLVGSSRREIVALTRFILWIALAGAGGGIAAGLAAAAWATSRVTRPVKQLSDGAREVAAGNWNARVEIDSTDEIGELARAFNHMTGQLIGQRERLVQSERVAAWRELARRLAHELKNPLFPLQITIENLQRARALHPEQFDDVFKESTATLLAELSNLKTIVGRFSDFARMPPPQFQSVDLNEVVRGVLKLFDAQFQSPGGPAIASSMQLDETINGIQGDPEQLGRALRNLVLNALDAMPGGGTLTVRTASQNGTVRLEVSDTGGGLTPEECSRLFTPYYTSKQHGTGLGLAIVQSVVSDHGGRITVSSEPGQGTTFRIDLPVDPMSGARRESGAPVDR